MGATLKYGRLLYRGVGGFEAWRVSYRKPCMKSTSRDLRLPYAFLMPDIGYARVSTKDQNPAGQTDVLKAAGCKKLFVDHSSGKLARRPALTEALGYLREGDSLVVTKLDRLGRSVKNLKEIVDELEQREIGLKAVTQGIDTTTPGAALLSHACRDRGVRARPHCGANQGRARRCKVPRPQRGPAPKNDGRENQTGSLDVRQPGVHSAGNCGHVRCDAAHDLPLPRTRWQLIAQVQRDQRGEEVVLEGEQRAGGCVPRLRKYTRDQCDSRSTLIRFGWTDSDIDRLLGEPDAVKVHGGEAFGAERVLLAALSDEALLSRMSKEARPHYYLNRLLPESAENPEPLGVILKLEKHPWLVLCQSIDARVGEVLTAPSANGIDIFYRQVTSIYSRWRDFALVKAKQHSDRPKPVP